MEKISTNHTTSSDRIKIGHFRHPIKTSVPSVYPEFLFFCVIGVNLDEKLYDGVYFVFFAQFWPENGRKLNFKN